MAVDIANRVSNGLSTALNSFKDVVPSEFHPYFTIAFFIVIITLYVLFIWRFHKFIAKRDILEINLRKYNTAEHPALKKTIALAFFLVEYIILLPIFVFFWFFVMALIFLLIAKDYQINQIILISACIVGVIRIVSYYNQQLSEDISKLFPFTILIISLTSTDFFNIQSTIDKITSIPQFFTSIIIYILFIVIVEFIMRIIYIFTNLSRIER
ncbi:MAG TPA: hypothetical protein VI815_00130 [Candidatus Nanoarchaeia archaeon]|nr:hypothetical protein [Candidatus Nanoarchaeia archaeon]